MRLALLATVAAAVAVAGCGSVSATGHATEAPASLPELATPARTATRAPGTLPPTTAPTRSAAPASRTPASKPPPPPVSKPPAPKPPPPAPKASCYPLSDEGTCYEPGEYCRDADHGATGVAGDGEAISCADNDGWRWEPR